MTRRPPRLPPFPYTPLSRSQGKRRGRLRLAPALPPPPVHPEPLARVLADPPFHDPVDHRRRRGDVHLALRVARQVERDRKSTRLNSSHANISYAVFCLKKKN